VKGHAYRAAPVADPRDQALVDEWTTRDPLPALRRRLPLSDREAEAISASVDAELADAIAFAEASPYPDPGEALEGMFT
jgi:pyruvate dehydrogenase E1 component alpha subunit